MKKVNNLTAKAKTLAQLVINTAEQYQQSDDQQKSLLETTVGAAIWYLPSLGHQLFSQKISKRALESLENNPETTKLVEEHGTPRKVAGRLLYTQYLEEIKSNPEVLKDLYLTQFGKYNLVLKEENRGLMKHQKVDTFVSEEYAYQQAGIELVDFSEDQYRAFKRGTVRKKVEMA